MSVSQTTNSRQEAGDDLDRRDFLKMSTLVPTSAAFGALAASGIQQAAAYGTAEGGHTGLSASMSEEEIAALPRVKQGAGGAALCARARAGGQRRPQGR